MRRKMTVAEAQAFLATPLSTHLAAIEHRRDQVRRAGVDPRSALGHKLMAKMEATGDDLCLAKTREGRPCRALGSGKGGRCKNHGGMSTGPTTTGGKARAMAALALARVKQREGRISNRTLPEAADANFGVDSARAMPTSKGTDHAAVD